MIFLYRNACEWRKIYVKDDESDVRHGSFSGTYLILHTKKKTKKD